MKRALVLFPVLGASAGYLLDGVPGAASDLVIPLELLIVGWLFGTR